MGINYYIDIDMKLANGKCYYERVCHIGKGSHLDIISLSNFFVRFCENNDDSLYEITRKLKEDKIEESDVGEFRELLNNLYNDFCSEEFTCEDEYGSKISFRDIINKMKNDHKYMRHGPRSYTLDGLYIDDSTDFF